jgi:hypothetical protein
MVKDKLITDKNINECKEQDLEAMERYLFESDDAMLDITPIKINKKRKRVKKCGKART